MKTLKEQFKDLGYNVQYINKLWTTADINNATSILILTYRGNVLNKEIKLHAKNRNKKDYNILTVMCFFPPHLLILLTLPI